MFPATGEDTAFWLYTSGTTGFPKAAVHRHVDLGFLTDAYARGVLAMGPNDRVYSVPKLFFAYGLGNAYFALGTGATLVLHDARPTVEAVAAHVARHRVTLFFAVPTFLAQTLGADVDPAAFASVRQGITGGEPLPPDIGRRFLDRFGVELLDGIGTTELGHIFISQRPGRVRPGATGWPVDGFEVELRADDGSLVPDGEPGNLHVAGESVTTGYWRRTDLNRRVFNGRFLATGDTFVRNDDGSYTYLGRNDDMIKGRRDLGVAQRSGGLHHRAGRGGGGGRGGSRRCRRADQTQSLRGPLPGRGHPRRRRVGGPGPGPRESPPGAVQVPPLGGGARRAPSHGHRQDQALPAPPGVSPLAGGLHRQDQALPAPPGVSPPGQRMTRGLHGSR